MRHPRNSNAKSSLRKLRRAWWSGCPFVSWGKFMRRRWKREKTVRDLMSGRSAISAGFAGATAMDTFLDEFEALPEIAPMLPAARRDISRDLAAGRISIIDLDGEA